MNLLGIDVGGTDTDAGIVTDKGELKESASWKTPRSLEEFRELLRDIKRRFPSYDHVGVGIPGLWEERSGKIRFAPNLPFLQEIEVRKIVREVFPEAKVHNDATVATLGEAVFGNGRGYDNFLMITLGTGIGGGLYMGGQVFTGERGFAGEVGHIKVNPSGIRCGCGAVGCWETEASASALIRKYMEKTGLSLPGEEISARAKRGEKEALEVFRDVGYWLGIGLSSLINVLDPQAVIIGGGLSLSFELFRPAMEETLRENSYVYRYSKPEILPALLRKKAGIIGAAAYGWKGRE